MAILRALWGNQACFADGTDQVSYQQRPGWPSLQTPLYVPTRWIWNKKISKKCYRFGGKNRWISSKFGNSWKDVMCYTFSTISLISENVLLDIIFGSVCTTFCIAWAATWPSVLWPHPIFVLFYFTSNLVKWIQPSCWQGKIFMTFFCVWPTNLSFLNGFSKNIAISAAVILAHWSATIMTPLGKINKPCNDLLSEHFGT